ncbi:MAG: hypothetical protein JXN64_01335 [Spirochaetes bacterium]|nr:hypothetical protein [Spirochaetota bacterium]
MRDDLFYLFKKLVPLYKEKFSCLEKITSNEIQLRSLLRSDNIQGINDLLLADKEIFIKLDSIEFDIQALINGVCKTAGIEKENFDKYFLSRDEEPLPELKMLKTQADKQTADLISSRDKIIRDMRDHLAEIKIDIESLKKIRELDNKRPF